jgi:hypothetical protein
VRFFSFALLLLVAARAGALGLGVAQSPGAMTMH